MAKSDPAKSTVKTGELQPQPHGGAIRHGGPNRGGPGRPRNEFKAMCRELASSQAVEQRVREILADPKHPMFLGALKWASEHGYGKPTEKHEVTGADGGPIQQVIKIGTRVIAF